MSEFLKDLELPVRLYNGLVRYKIDTPEKFYTLTWDEFKHFDMLGRKSWHELVQVRDNIRKSAIRSTKVATASGAAQELNRIVNDMRETGVFLALDADNQIRVVRRVNIEDAEAEIAAS